MPAANPAPCPRCHEHAMGPWRPLDAFLAVISGNEFKSTCCSCGAVEQRPKKPGEYWVPAEPERKRA